MLSVENLENFNRSSEPKHKPSFVYSEHNPNIILKSNFDYQMNHVGKYPLYEHRWKMLQNIKSIATLQDVSLTSIDGKQQGKEVDEISTTSSKTNTNFTGNQRNVNCQSICSFIPSHFQLFPSTTHNKDWPNPKQSAQEVTRSPFSSSSWRWFSP